MADDAPPTIPGVTVGALLGRGGFATVYAAIRDGTSVAVKLAHVATATARERTAREFAALERLAGLHAPLPLATGDVAGRPYLIMSRISGVRPRASDAAAIARAVAELHARNVVHGDLAPPNIAAGDSVAFLDFGSAVVDGSATASGATVAYTAPERWRGEPPTAATDVYALGAIIYQLVRGRPPFVGEQRIVAHGHLMLRPDLASIAPELAALLARCLAKDPARRPTAAELADALAATRTEASRESARELRATVERTCAVVIADVRAPAPQIAQRIAAHGGELLYLRGERTVAAWPGHEGRPAERAVAAARELHAEHGARAFVTLARIACDAATGELRPTRETLAGAPERWHGVIGSAELAQVLRRRAAPGELVDLLRDDRDGLAPLIGRDRELADAASRTRPVVIVAPRGAGRSHFARHLAARVKGQLVTPGTSPRDLSTRPLVVDDADAATDELLAALPRDRLVALICAPEHARRFAGERLELAPLADRDAAVLLAQQLQIDRIPDEVVQRLLAIGAGLPARLVDLAAHLEQSGAVRTRAERRYLAADAISTADEGDWLAEAALAGLPAELRDLVAIASVLEPGFEVGELEAAATATDATIVDPALALVELATRRLARATDGQWRLAIARTTLDPQPIAAAALAFGDRAWAGQLDARRRRALARYAAQTGDRARAATLLRELADDARFAHRDAAAEADYTAALAGIADRPDSARALYGRGIVRYRLDRAADALADLEAAAERFTDPRAKLRAQLEAATALDWLGRYAESAELPAAPPEPPADIACALAMARGRSALRMGRPHDAARELAAAADAPTSIATDEHRVIALLLLGPVLLQLGDHVAAERRMADALVLAEQLGDTLAWCAAFGNRAPLWAARGDHARALADLAAARDLARRLGHAVPERNTTYNLAEYLYWSGELAEAHRLAMVARELQQRLVGRSIEDELLVARIAAARGDTETSRASLAAIADVTLPTQLRCLSAAVAAMIDRDLPRAIANAEHARRELVGEELAEVLSWLHAVAPTPDLATEACSISSLQRWRFGAGSPPQFAPQTPSSRDSSC